VVVGKLFVTAADDNEFAHGKYGKGDTQFMNLAFNFNPATLFAAPYTPVGGGLVILPNKNPEAASLKAIVFSATGTATKAGFDNFDHDDLGVSFEGRVRTHFFGKTGHQDAGYMHSNKEFTSLDQRLSLDPGTRLLEKKSGSWVVFYNFDQYLHERAKGRGFGIFGRFGASDGNPNFLHYFYSLGVGGTGVGAKRPNDSYGIGGYYIDISNPTLTTPLGTKQVLRDEKGIEAFYSIALTPWANLSPDMQIVHGARRQVLTAPPRNINTAVVLGLRLGLTF
jgi:porin